MSSVTDLLGADYQPPRSQSAAVPRGLPPAAYASEAFFELECRRLFARNWMFAAFAQDLPATGDLVPLTLAGRPLLLARTGDGAIRAYHNVCRHRGHLLVDAPCRAARSIVCPYHAWSYGLDGTLLRTPHFGGTGRGQASGFDRAAHGLLEVRCAVWHDWIFINLDGAAAPLEEHLCDLRARLGDVDWDTLTPVARFEIGEVQCNWKFLIENFVEPYHVPVVHRKTAAGQPLKSHRMFVDDNCFGCLVSVDEDQPDGTALADHLNMSSHYFAVFPNFILARYFPNQLGVHLNLPLAANRTRQWRAIYFTGAGQPSAEAVDDLVQLWRSVHAEDHRATVQLQAGRASSGAADGGVLSPHWETSIAHFHDLIFDALR